MENKSSYRDSTEMEKKVLTYLNELRESGKINMIGAVPYIIEEFNIERGEAVSHWKLWMENFNPQGMYNRVKSTF